MPARLRDRAWLWWHMTAQPRRAHAYKRLVGDAWVCSCGSRHRVW